MIPLNFLSGVLPYVAPASRVARNFVVSRSRLLVALFLVSATLAGTADAADGMEARRVAQNSANLQKMAPSMRPKIRAVLSDMEGAGYKPLIDNAVWRSRAEQLALFHKGYSKVTYSFHNASTPAGKPDSLAADITDQRWGWTGLSPRRYWLTQARSGWVHNLYSGSHFGLSSAQKKVFDAALNSPNFAAYSGPLGWDVAHLEPRGLTTAQAKAGKRPYSAPLKKTVSASR